MQQSVVARVIAGLKAAGVSARKQKSCGGSVSCDLVRRAGCYDPALGEKSRTRASLCVGQIV